MNEKRKSHITGRLILLLMPVMAVYIGCGNDADVDSSQTVENAESDDGRIEDESIDITMEKDKTEPQEAETVDDSENLDTDNENELDNAEIYELFLNGELMVEQEEEQLTVSELFLDNDIEYCFLDIDGDGSDELHIRDNTAYYAIKAVDGTLQILFQSWGNDYEPIVADELCGFLDYFNRGYGNEIIRFTKISAVGSREWEMFGWTDANENGYMDEEDDFYAETDSSDYEEIDMEKYAQYREEHYVKQAGHELKWKNRRLKDFATWQEAYIDFINKTQTYNDKAYSLAYVDSDDVPELCIDTNYGVTEYIVSFYDGKVRAMNLSRGYKIKYIEHDGRFYTRDSFCDVYMLEKGEFSEIGTGWVYTHYYFYTGFRYKYFWEGTEVTEEELEECINKLIDTSQCIEPSELYTKHEMLKILAE